MFGMMRLVPKRLVNQEKTIVQRWDEVTVPDEAINGVVNQR
jgi:hypothetical protein